MAANREKELIRQMQALHVDYPAFAAAESRVLRCHSRSRAKGESDGAVILGESGVGKSWLAHRILKRFPNYETEEGLVIPCIYVEAPKKASIHGVISSVLFQTKYQGSTRMPIPQLELAMLELLVFRKVEIIILDEFQHMGPTENKKLETADWVKTIFNKSKCAVVLMGTPSSDTILRSSECQQTAQRFKRPMLLQPFGWTAECKGADFRRFLMMYSRPIEILANSKLSAPDTAARLYAATGGYLRPLAYVLEEAAVLAVERGERSVTLELLQEAMESEVAEVIPLHKAPFNARLPEVLDSIAEGKSVVAQGGPESRRPIRRKARREREVLRP